MTDQSVQPDAWAAIANELERIAADLRKLVGHAPPGLFSIDVQPFGEVHHPPIPEQRDETIQAVDDVATVLFGAVAQTKEMSGGKAFHHSTSGRRGKILVSVYQAIAGAEAE
jgi:hypothetical protein